jgi:hypothetical protein
MIKKRRYTHGRWLLAFAVAIMLPLSACEDEPTHALFVFDVSGSSRSANTGLVLVARQRLVEKVDQVEEGDSITAYGFNYKPGNSCQPIKADFPRQDNSETADQLKEDLKAGIPTTFDSYVECLINDEHGYSGKGSAIFGAIPAALIKAGGTEKISSIHLVTDGCSFGEGDPTCSKTMLKKDFAKQFVESLPVSLKPDLDGCSLVVEGLGQGTDLQSDRIAVLREIWIAYGSATGATTNFI